MATILYTVATDKTGKLIKANDAEKGSDFFCPVCKTDLILRKSGKTGKGTKRPHFAHRSLTPNCTPETALHYAFKNLLADKLQQHITTQTPLLFSWNCMYCGIDHSGNLLKKVKAVKVEHNLSVCQPDIALFEDNEKVFAAIEVVVTHKPEENVVKFYNDNNIILIQINLTSDKDIEELETKISRPYKVGTCFNPKCKTCGRYQTKKTLTVIDGPCWKCGSNMKIATISSANGSISKNHPEEFSEDEIEFAKSKGVLLKTQYSKTMREKYLANSCAKCGSFTGNFYIFTGYISPAAYGELPSETFDMGYSCLRCSNDYSEDDNDIIEEYV